MKSAADVIIVGAGLSGLVAAVKLRQRGVSTLVLEARPRGGGRILTVDSGVAGESVDLGGELIGSFHHSIRALADEFGIGLKASGTSGSELIPDDVIADGEKLGPRVIAGLRAELSHLIDRLVRLAAPISASQPWSSTADLEALDAVSVDAWLANEGASELLRVLFTDLAPHAQSMLALLCLIAGGGGSNFFYHGESWIMDGGTSRLIQALLPQAGTVVFGAVVQRVARQWRKILVEFGLGKIPKQVTAQAVIFAVPSGCLRALHPSRDALSLLPAMATNQKLTLFAECPRGSFLKEGFTLTDSAVRTINVSQILDDVYRLDVFACPHLAKNSSRRDELIHLTRKFLGCESAPFVEAHMLDWREEEFSRGSYPVLGPGCITRSLRHLQDCLNCCHLVGDYLNPCYAGYMEGAVQSALQTVDKMLR